MARALPITHLQALLDRLGADGRTVVGPVARDGAVVLEPVRIVDELAQGWRDEQAPGRYRLVPGEPRVFGALLGPQSPKTWLYPAKLTLFRAERDGASFRTTSPDRPPRLALLGLRACDLAAIRLQDRVLLGSGVEDPAYASRRREVLLVAVQCHRSAETCFCASMDTGPEVSSGYDLRLTEVIDERGHRLVVEAGSEAGRAIAADLPLVDVPHDDDAASRQAAEARAGQSKSLRTEGLRERLLDALRGPHWDEVATRCLGCAGCTMVCPTCFCTAVADVTDATGAAERVRRWDSCFHPEFTHVHGGPTRAELAARYRQWLTHKLATW
ncbi:MAG: 4Fe-4S dicluster domain-containing protein, partial [Alphaproteobacteria bacterium]|nr:4Fe-4S dicluster domain-containing protein [Alphaproteobacteria bacterium]